MVNWKVRPYQEGDEAGIVALQNMEFRDCPYTLERWLWRYRKNPYGFMTAVAEHDGEIVGHMGWWLLKMRIGDKIITASQASELVVHPKYRRQGMFLAIGRSLARIAAEQEIYLTYGFPNAPAYSGHLQYGWVDAAQIPVLTGYFDTYPMVKKPLSYFTNILYRKLGKSVDDPSISVIDRFPPEIFRLTDEVLSNHSISVIRDAKYLNWRFFENPEQQYTALSSENGYAVTTAESRGRRRIGYVVDIVAKDDSSFVSLIRQAVSGLAEHGVDSIKCLAQLSSHRALLQRAGFTGFPKRMQTLIARVNSPSFQKTYEANSQDWYITYGDCDFI